MARKTSRLAALATTFLLAAAGGEALAQTPVDVLGGAGGFDTADWHFQGPDGASFAREACEGFTGSCARIEGDDLGVRPYDAQLVHWNGAIPRPRFVTLQGGKQYRIQLRASASVANKTVQVALEDAIYRVVGAASFTPGRAAAVHTAADAIVIPAADGSRQVSVRVNVGGAANAGVAFSIDDLAILEEDAGPPPDPSAGTNLIAGGDMESYSRGVWNHYYGPDWQNTDQRVTAGAEACTGFTGSCLRITSTDWGADVYSTQLVYSSNYAAVYFPLSKTKTYELKLRAAASAAGKSIQVVLQDSSYAGAHATTFTLGDTAADYTTGQFTIPASVMNTNLALLFNFGPESANDGVTFSLDDIALIERDP